MNKLRVGLLFGGCSGGMKFRLIQHERSSRCFKRSHNAVSGLLPGTFQKIRLAGRSTAESSEIHTTDTINYQYCLNGAWRR